MRKKCQKRGLLYKEISYLNKREFLRVYYNDAALSVHSWKIQSQQKYAIRIIFQKNKFAHTREHFKENHTLNIYQLNIVNIPLFLHRVEKNEKAPNVFLSKFLQLLQHKPYSFSQNNYIATH